MKGLWRLMRDGHSVTLRLGFLIHPPQAKGAVSAGQPPVLSCLGPAPSLCFFASSAPSGGSQETVGLLCVNTAFLWAEPVGTAVTSEPLWDRRPGMAELRPLFTPYWPSVW